MSEQPKWKTGITKVEPNHLVTRGYRQEDLIGNVPFSHVVYLLWKGELPGEAQGRMMDALITAGIDHGVTPPSAQAARVVYSGGVPVPTAIAAGIMAVGDAHGGAMENAMRMLQDGVRKAKEENISLEEYGARLPGELKASGKRVPGLGHRIHTDDPRAKRLLALADELGVAGEHVALFRAIQAEVAKKKPLPINVDGAIGAIASDMGFAPRLGKAFFVLGRVAGLSAHVLEEEQRFKRMRKVYDAEVQYDGPGERELPDEYRKEE